MTGRDSCRAAYAELLDLLPGIGEATGWTPTRCAGWTVRDLLLHLLSDARFPLLG